MHSTETEDHAVKVAEVFGFNDKFDDGFAVVVVMDVDAADVGVVVGDDGGEFLKHAGAVVAVDRDFDGIALRTAAIFAYAGPLDGDAAVALVKQVLHIGAAAGVNGDAFAAGDVADDFFAADRVATARAVDEEIVLALDLE